jgi:hypothetical protein
MAKQRRRGTPERNPLGLGANERESSNTGSIEDTAYDAVASDPYLTGEPRKEFARRSPDARAGAGEEDATDDVPPREG